MASAGSQPAAQQQETDAALQALVREVRATDPSRIDYEDLVTRAWKVGQASAGERTVNRQEATDVVKVLQTQLKQIEDENVVSRAWKSVNMLFANSVPGNAVIPERSEEPKQGEGWAAIGSKAASQLKAAYGYVKRAVENIDITKEQKERLVQAVPLDNDGELWLLQEGTGAGEASRSSGRPDATAIPGSRSPYAGAKFNPPPPKADALSTPGQPAAGVSSQDFQTGYPPSPVASSSYATPFSGGIQASGAAEPASPPSTRKSYASYFKGWDTSSGAEPSAAEGRPAFPGAAAGAVTTTPSWNFPRSTSDTEKPTVPSGYVPRATFALKTGAPVRENEEKKTWLSSYAPLTGGSGFQPGSSPVWLSTPTQSSQTRAAQEDKPATAFPAAGTADMADKANEDASAGRPVFPTQNWQAGAIAEEETLEEEKTAWPTFTGFSASGAAGFGDKAKEDASAGRPAFPTQGWQSGATAEEKKTQEEKTSWQSFPGLSASGAAGTGDKAKEDASAGRPVFPTQSWQPKGTDDKAKEDTSARSPAFPLQSWQASATPEENKPFIAFPAADTANTADKAQPDTSMGAPSFPAQSWQARAVAEDKKPQAGKNSWQSFAGFSGSGALGTGDKAKEDASAGRPVFPTQSWQSGATAEEKKPQEEKTAWQSFTGLSASGATGTGDRPKEDASAGRPAFPSQSWQPKGTTAEEKNPQGEKNSLQSFTGLSASGAAGIGDKAKEDASAGRPAFPSQSWQSGATPEEKTLLEDKNSLQSFASGAAGIGDDAKEDAAAGRPAFPTQSWQSGSTAVEKKPQEEKKSWQPFAGFRAAGKADKADEAEEDSSAGRPVFPTRSWQSAWTQAEKKPEEEQTSWPFSSSPVAGALGMEQKAKDDAKNSDIDKSLWFGSYDGPQLFSGEEATMPENKAATQPTPSTPSFGSYTSASNQAAPSTPALGSYASASIRGATSTPSFGSYVSASSQGAPSTPSFGSYAPPASSNPSLGSYASASREQPAPSTPNFGSYAPAPSSYSPSVDNAPRPATAPDATRFGSYLGALKELGGERAEETTLQPSSWGSYSYSAPKASATPSPPVSYAPSPQWSSAGQPVASSYGERRPGTDMDSFKDLETKPASTAPPTFRSYAAATQGSYVPPSQGSYVPAVMGPGGGNFADFPSSPTSSAPAPSPSSYVPAPSRRPGSYVDSFKEWETQPASTAPPTFGSYAAATQGSYVPPSHEGSYIPAVMGPGGGNFPDFQDTQSSDAQRTSQSGYAPTPSRSSYAPAPSRLDTFAGAGLSNGPRPSSYTPQPVGETVFASPDAVRIQQSDRWRPLVADGLKPVSYFKYAEDPVTPGEERPGYARPIAVEQTAYFKRSGNPPAESGRLSSGSNSYYTAPRPGSNAVKPNTPWVGKTNYAPSMYFKGRKPEAPAQSEAAKASRSYSSPMTGSTGTMPTGAQVLEGTVQERSKSDFTSWKEPTDGEQ